MRLPSGDQAGSWSKPWPSVSLVITPPPAGTVQIAPWYDTAIVLPSGETRGWMAPSAGGNGVTAFTSSCVLAEVNSASPTMIKLPRIARTRFMIRPNLYAALTRGHDFHKREGEG